ncbi:MmpS family transport accessory protein [Actinomycetospora sp. NBRC 106375]|uniref:MmpS family transport accessory protein n=1 Tax=Actinomycetospora sp. NBRC 106375 TaxID=3032207 RepID=UPI002554C2C3|nr:MmpS family transport accessory protein [Actinomycetospora sp. NBRC 106375]
MTEHRRARGDRRRWPWAVGAVVVGFAIGGGLALAGSGAPAATPVSRSGPASPTAGVVYELSGDAARVLVTSGPIGGVARENGVGLPWRRTASPARAPATYTLTAQSSSAGAGQITCRITVDGRVVAEQTSTLPYTVASCVGRVSGQ